MNLPSNLLYTAEHEWVRIEGDTAVVGITDYAQDTLGDVVYLELPEVGAMLTVGRPFGVVESVKAASDLFAPLSGQVIEVNHTLVRQPEEINSDPYGASWMIKIRLSNPDEKPALLDAAGYRDLVQG